MNYLIILLICLPFFINAERKSVFKIKIERILIAKSNENYVIGKMWTTKINRFTNVGNGYLYIQKNIPLDTKVMIKVYEFLHNEYRPFAINLERQICTFMQQDYKTFFYPDLIKVDAIMPEPKCPVLKGNYSFANYTVDDSNFPKTLPFNNLKLEIVLWYRNSIILQIEAFATLDRDAVIRERYT